MIEAKAYDSNCTEEEKQAIKDRIYIYKDDIIIYKEVPVLSVYQLTLFMEKIDQLVKQLGTFRILIDVRDVSITPDAKLRAILKEYFSHLNGLKYMAVCTGKNILVNIAVKYVVASFGFKQYSIHKTIEQGFDALENAASNMGIEP